MEDRAYGFYILNRSTHLWCCLENETRMIAIVLIIITITVTINIMLLPLLLLLILIIIIIIIIIITIKHGSELERHITHNTSPLQQGLPSPTLRLAGVCEACPWWSTITSRMSGAQRSKDYLGLQRHQKPIICIPWRCFCDTKYSTDAGCTDFIFCYIAWDSTLFPGNIFGD